MKKARKKYRHKKARGGFGKNVMGRAPKGYKHRKGHVAF